MKKTAATKFAFDMFKVTRPYKFNSTVSKNFSVISASTPEAKVL